MGYNVKGLTPVAIRAIVSSVDAWQMLSTIYMVIIIAGDNIKAAGISNEAIVVRLYD